jgi:putative ABC transport system permease protein
MTGTFHDIRYTLRGLWKAPGFTAVTVLTFALGIGANTAVFSVVDAVLLRPLTYSDSERLVVLHETVAQIGRVPVGVGEFIDWRDESKSFEHIALMAVAPVILTGTGQPERLEAARVSASFFPMLGVEPVLGRTFSADEEVLGRHRMIVLSDRLWRRRFAADRSIVGRAVTLNDEPFVVAGVLSPQFRFPRLEQIFAMGIPGGQPELWLPFAVTDVERTENSFAALAKLKPGVTPDQARAELDIIQRRYAQRIANPPQLGADVVRLREQVTGPSRNTLSLLWAAIASVLLIACGNIANLLLVRASARGPELAIRSALGASRGNLLRHSIIDSLTLAALGGLAGVVVAWWSLDLLVKFAPEAVPRLDEVAINGRALIFAFVLTAATGLLVGLLPARRAALSNLIEGLRASARTGSATRRDHAVRGLMVSMQTALTVACLAASGLVVHSLLNVLNVEPGFESRQLLTVDVGLSPGRYPTREARATFVREALQALDNVPGITGAAVVNRLPLNGAGVTSMMVVAGTEGASVPMLERPVADIRSVNANYFGTLGIPLLAGRLFREAEETRPVAVIAETTAQRAWPGESAIGKRFRLAAQRNRVIEVIGVVGDVRHRSLEESPSLTVYLPYSQGFLNTTSFALKTTTNPTTTGAAIRSAIASVDPDVPLQSVRTMETVVAESVSARSLQAGLLMTFGAIAMTLAAIGIFGVMSYAVAQRSKELGIRLALGATRTSVQRMIVGNVLRLIGVGLALGVPLAMIVGYAMRNVLFGVSPQNPIVLAISAGLIALVAVAAAAIPARRAGRVDPIIALRYE